MRLETNCLDSLCSTLYIPTMYLYMYIHMYMQLLSSSWYDAAHVSSTQQLLSGHCTNSSTARSSARRILLQLPFHLTFPRHALTCGAVIFPHHAHQVEVVTFPRVVLTCNIVTFPRHAHTCDVVTSRRHAHTCGVL